VFWNYTRSIDSFVEAFKHDVAAMLSHNTKTKFAQNSDDFSV